MTNSTVLLSIDDARWKRECAQAGHPRWDRWGCYCRARSAPASPFRLDAEGEALQPGDIR